MGETDEQFCKNLIALTGADAACFALLRRAKRAEAENEHLLSSHSNRVDGYFRLLDLFQDIELRCASANGNWELTVAWIRAECRAALRGRRTREWRDK